MTLIAAGAADAPILAAIHATAFPPGAAWDDEAIAALLGLDGAFALRAGEAGFILARRTLDEAEILTLAVRPPARRGGIGRALVKAALTAVASAGATAMFLEVAKLNEAAIHLYAAEGFKKVSLRRDYYAPGEHALVMRCALGA